MEFFMFDPRAHRHDRKVRFIIRSRLTIEERYQHLLLSNHIA